VPPVPPFPQELLYLWDWFRELSGYRSVTGFGWQRITPLDYVAHALLFRRWPERWELDALTALDLAWLEARAPGDSDDLPPAERRRAERERQQA